MMRPSIAAVSVSKYDGESDRRPNLGKYFSRLQSVVRPRASASLPPNIEASETTFIKITKSTEAEPRRLSHSSESSSANVQEISASSITISHQPATSLPNLDLGPNTSYENLDGMSELLISSPRSGFSYDTLRDACASFGLESSSLRNQRRMGEMRFETRSRIERPVQLRVYLICHVCSMRFHRESQCSGCGHEPCPDCSKGPATQVSHLLAAAKSCRERNDDITTVVPTFMGFPLAQYQPGPTANMPALPPLECDPNCDEDDDDEQADAIMTDAVLATFSRHVRRMESQPDRESPSVPHRTAQRSCHKCGLGFSMAARHVCVRCRHVRCPRCPRSVVSRGGVLADSSADQDESETKSESVIPASRRVYRQPRQRVRYTCEHCRTIFITANRCIECGHQRCRNCIRDP